MIKQHIPLREQIRKAARGELYQLRDVISPVCYVSDYNTMNDALSAIGSANTTLCIDDAKTVTADVTIPATCSVSIAKGAIISHSTYTLTINGPFEAGRYQVFSGTGAVTFGDSSLVEVYPEWWYSGTGGWETAFTAAIAAVPRSTYGGGVIKLLNKVYSFTAGIVIDRSLSMIGYDNNLATTQLSFASDIAETSGIEITCSYVALKGLTVKGAGCLTQYGIHINYDSTVLGRFVFESVHTWFWHTGFKADTHTWLMSFRDCYAAFHYSCGYDLAPTTTLLMERCYANARTTDDDEVAIPYADRPSYGFKISDGSSVCLIDCAADNHRYYGFYFTDTEQINIMGCGVELNGAEAFIFHNCGVVTINGLWCLCGNETDTADEATVLRAVNGGTINISGVKEWSIGKETNHSNVVHSIMIENTVQANLSNLQLFYDVYTDQNYGWVEYSVPKWITATGTWTATGYTTLTSTENLSSVLSEGDLIRIKVYDDSASGTFVKFSRVVSAVWTTVTTVTILNDLSGYTAPPDASDSWTVDYCPPEAYVKVRGTRKETQGTAAPTVGTWAVGDICWNTAPAATDPPGWVCTNASGSGTWTPMAELGLAHP